jgi:hypothetical protein
VTFDIKKPEKRLIQEKQKKDVKKHVISVWCTEYLNKDMP